MLAPAFQGFNQYPPPTPIYSSPPQIFYFAGYPNGPISPTYIQPLPIPPHAFHHFPPDRPTLVSTFLWCVALCALVFFAT